jgi:transposase
MMKTMKDSIGIDISKAHLDVHHPDTGTSARFSNDPVGFRALTRFIGPKQPDLVVYEATGPYHARFEQAFSRRLPLVKVNPLQARRFSQACGTRAKTDAVDARMLAQMGSALDLVPDVPAAEDQNELKELQIARTALVKDRTRLKNRLKTQTLGFTRRQTKARLAQIERQLEALQSEMASLINACPKRTRAYAILRSIHGIGEVAAAAILIECPEIGTLGKKQAACLAGLAPMTRQSGTWKGKAFIQGGRKHLRDALYMPALVASRFNPDLRDKYQAMINGGKPAKVALTTIMRKLIELANALIRHDRKWKPKLA